MHCDTSSVGLNPLVGCRQAARQGYHWQGYQNWNASADLSIFCMLGFPRSLDTGTDYTHPFLSGGFGPGFKVAGGFDLVGDDYTGENTPMLDPDPLDQCSG
jgi:hypothetical protein